MDGLHIHQWPDDEFLTMIDRKTTHRLQAKQQAVPPEGLAFAQSK